MWEQQYTDVETVVVLSQRGTMGSSGREDLADSLHMT